MYMDDSATHGALMDKHLQPLPLNNINGGVPVTSAGGILVAQNAEAAITAEVRALRRRIKRALDLDFFPELHMRLMWGTNLPRKDGNRSNPYLLATPEQRLRWVKHGYDIIFKYGRTGQLKTIGISTDLLETQEVFKRYCEDQHTADEHSILKKYFPRAVGKFYSVMLNPLIRMVANLIVAGDYFCRTNGHRLDVFYDTSEASKGFAASDGINILHTQQRFRSVEKISELSPHDSELMQLADFVAYRIFRGKMLRYRKEHQLMPNTDEGMELAVRRRDMSKIGLELPDGVQIESFHESLIAMLQIAYAAQPLRALYPDLAEAMLVPLSQYRTDVDEHGSLTGFFPLFRHEVIEAWRNGKRPPL